MARQHSQKCDRGSVLLSGRYQSLVHVKITRGYELAIVANWVSFVVKIEVTDNISMLLVIYNERQAETAMIDCVSASFGKIATLLTPLL